MIQFPIFYKRDKGPKTPNFRKLSVMFHDKAPTKIPINRKIVTDRHGGVGIKMNFVCDIMEKLERIKSEVEIWRKGKVVYIRKKELYDLTFNLDIYIFELYSLLDLFSLEIATILKSRKKVKNNMRDIKYFMDLKEAIGLSSETKQKVDCFMKQHWFKYFHKMRIRIVHRLPIGLMALLYGETIEFPFFSDEPLNPKSVSKKKIEPLTECKKWLEEVFGFVDDVCGDLGRELFDTF